MTLAKRILVCALLSIMLLVSVSPVFAETPSAGSNNQNQSNNQGIIGKQMQKYYEDEDHKPGLMERTIADPLISVANFLLNFFGAKDVVTLVFGIDPNSTDQREGLYLGVFTEGMMNAIDALYSSFERFMPFPVILAVMLIAALLLFQGMSADGRSKAKDYMVAFLVGLLSIRFGYYIWNFVAYVTQKFSTLIWATMLDHDIQPDKFLNMIWGAGTGYDDMIKYRGFVVALLVLLAAIMTAVLNYQYTMRTINLMVLVSTFVVSAVLTIFPRYRQSLQTWWNEFTSQMLLPCAHALALGLFFLLLRYSSDDVSNWIIVAYLFGFSTIQALVTRLLGGEDGGGGKVGKAMGFGTMMALSSILRKNKKGRQTKGVGDQGASESVGGDEGLESSGQAATATPAIKQQRQQGWKKTAGKMGGKAAGYALQYGSRAVGAIAGTSIGMMAGNPLVGAMVGAKAGGAVGGVLGKGTAMLGKGTIMLGKGSLLVGQKVAHGIGNRTSRSESEAAENPTEESLSNETGNEGYVQPMNLGGRRIGASRATSAASVRNGSSVGNKRVHNSRAYAGQQTNRPAGSAGIQNNGVSGSSVKSSTSGTRPVGSSGTGRGRHTVNTGIIIDGGKVNSDIISVNNGSSNNGSSNNHARTQNTGTSTSGRHNRGIWISGGDVKAKSIRVNGDTSGDGVRITGGQVEAEHITPNTDIRPNRPNTEVTPSNAPSKPAAAPAAPPQNRHYNYDL
ncbi:hypothetical protein D3C75_258950 [compost metagenome]